MPTEVHDRPAERSLNITNILLAILILLGGIFGTVMTDFMGNIKKSVDSMDESITSIQVTNGITVNEVKHLHKSIENIEDRVLILENKR